MTISSLCSVVQDDFQSICGPDNELTLEAMMQVGGQKEFQQVKRVTLIIPKCFAAASFLGSSYIIYSLLRTTKQHGYFQPSRQQQQQQQQGRGGGGRKCCCYCRCYNDEPNFANSRRSSSQQEQRRPHSSQPDLSTSFHRLLLGLSTCDVISSLSMFLSGWIVPSNPPSPYNYQTSPHQYCCDQIIYASYHPMAVGGEIFTSCTIQGSMFLIGVVGSLLFTAALAINCYLTIRHNWKERRLIRFEVGTIIFVLIFTIFGAIYLAAIDQFNPTSTGLCYIVPYPDGGFFTDVSNFDYDNPDVIRGNSDYRTLYGIVYGSLVIVASLLINVFCMISIFCYVRRRYQTQSSRYGSQQFQVDAAAATAVNSRNSKTNSATPSSNVPAITRNEIIRWQEQQRQHQNDQSGTSVLSRFLSRRRGRSRRRLTSREEIVLKKGLLYIGSFVLLYVPVLLTMLLSSGTKPYNDIFISILLSSQGILNLLVYAQKYDTIKRSIQKLCYNTQCYLSRICISKEGIDSTGMQSSPPVVPASTATSTTRTEGTSSSALAIVNATATSVTGTGNNTSGIHPARSGMGCNHQPPEIDEEKEERNNDTTEDNTSTNFECQNCQDDLEIEDCNNMDIDAKVLTTVFFHGSKL